LEVRVAIEASTVNKVRQAVAALAPAVVELGADPVQLHSYFDRLETAGNSRFLLLSPIAANELPRREIGPVSVHCESASGAWTLFGRSIVPIGQNTVRVDLTAARILPKRDAPAAIHRPHKHLALVTPIATRGTGGSDANVFPIVELDNDSCVVDVSTPFELGQFLPVVEIVGDRHVLRRCAASVFEIVPWCTPSGDRRFRCMLRLSENVAAQGSDLLEIVDDPTRVRRVLEFAAMSGALGWFETPSGDRGEARFIATQRDALELVLYPPREPASSRFIKVGFSLFACDYEAVVRVLQESQTHVRTAFPLHVRRGRSFRQEHRSSRSPEDLRVSFRNPVTGRSSEHPVVELSLHKLAFEVGSDAELLWEGLPLDDAHLHGSDREIRLGEVRVESLVAHGRSRRVEIAIQSPQTHKELTSLVHSMAHPEVSQHDGENFRNMLGIYKQAGLFAPHMRDNLDPVVPQAKRVWHTMHQAGSDLVQTFIHGPPDAPDGAGSVLRAWEHGWVAQHFVNVSQQFNGAAGHVLTALLDFVQRRPDGQHLVFFVKSDNRQMNSFLDRFLATSCTSEAGERRIVQFWQHRDAQQEVQTVESHCHVRTMRRAQEPLVAHAAERVFGEHGSAALSFTPGEFLIPDTTARYARVGVKRKRIASVVSAARTPPLWAVIEEVTSQGVNLTWMLNANWLFPIHGALDQDRSGLRAALKHILLKPRQSPTGDVFLNTAGDVDPSVLESAGFEKLGDIYMYSMNRTGISRMFYYTSDRYGEMDARTQQRQARRSGIRLRSGESLTSIAPKTRTG
jgi:hypothetical protein